MHEPRQEQTINKLSAKASQIYEKCKTQSNRFIEWAIQKKWQLFNDLHYEWWAFPNDRPSLAFGDQYQFEYNDVAILRKDQQFIRTISTNACLVCQSWNWDLRSGSYYSKQQSNECWSNSIITLYRMCICLDLFCVHQLFQNAIKFAIGLMKKWHSFVFAGTDYSQYFLRQFYVIKTKNQKQITEDKLIKQTLIEVNNDKPKQIPFQILQQVLSLKFTMKQKQLEEQVIRLLQGYQISLQTLKKWHTNKLKNEPYIAIYLPNRQLDRWQMKMLVIAASLFPHNLQLCFRDAYLQNTSKRQAIQLFYAMYYGHPKAAISLRSYIGQFTRGQRINRHQLYQLVLSLQCDYSPDTHCEVIHVPIKQPPNRRIDIEDGEGLDRFADFHETKEYYDCILKSLKKLGLYEHSNFKQVKQPWQYKQISSK